MNLVLNYVIHIGFGIYRIGFRCLGYNGFKYYWRMESSVTFTIQ